MFQSSTHRFVTYLREALLPERYCERRSVETDGFFERSWVEKALHVELDLSTCDHETGVERRAMAHIVMCGNTTVFVQLVDFGVQRRDLDPEKFECISTHDSCWKDAINDWLCQIYFTWSHEVAPDKAPKDLDSTCFLGCFTTHRFIEVEFRKKSMSESGYDLVAMQPWETSPLRQ